MLDQLSNLVRTNFDHIAMYVAKSSYLNHSMIMIILTYSYKTQKETVKYFLHISLVITLAIVT